MRFNWEEGQIWLYLCFCEILGRKLVSVDVMSQSYNKTHFCMVYIVWKIFPVFFIAFIIIIIKGCCTLNFGCF